MEQFGTIIWIFLFASSLFCYFHFPCQKFWKTRYERHLVAQNPQFVAKDPRESRATAFAFESKVLNRAIAYSRPKPFEVNSEKIAVNKSQHQTVNRREDYLNVRESAEFSCTVLIASWRLVNAFYKAVAFFKNRLF